VRGSMVRSMMMIPLVSTWPAPVPGPRWPRGRGRERSPETPHRA
jgi:hypothetical protein